MIITFYSYKGGVGRTQLLANLATYFSMHEYKKILIIDWDLEAPGIHFYFDKTTEQINKPGLYDVLNDYVKIRKSEKKVTNKESLPKFSKKKNITKLVQHKNPYSKEVGYISLISAGKNQHKNKYQQNIIDFNWYEFYELLDGKRYLEFLKNEIRKLGFDYVFIDSRTGINDYADICNIQMPEVNMLLAAPTNQNFEGIENISKRILESPYTKNGKYRNPIILPIISRVETDSPDFLSFFKRFKEQFSYLVKKIETYHKDFIFEDFDFFNDTMLTYNKFIAIGENILFHSKNEEIYGLAKKYQNIISYIKFLNNDYDITTFQNALYGELKKKTKKIDYIKWNNIGTELYDLKEYDKSIEAFEKSIGLKSDFYYAWNNLGKAYAKLNFFDKAISAYETAIKIQPNFHKIWDNLAITNIMRGKHSEAIKNYEKSIEIKPDYASSYYNLACLYSQQNEKNKAFEFLKISIDIRPEFQIRAKENIDFKKYWKDKRFISITT